jgi:hypothetical protein
MHIMTVGELRDATTRHGDSARLNAAFHSQDALITRKAFTLFAGDGVLDRVYRKVA